MNCWVRTVHYIRLSLSSATSFPSCPVTTTISSRLGVPSALVDRVSKKVSSGFVLVVDRLTRPLHLTHTPGDSAESLIICPCVFSEKLEFTNVDSTVRKILRSLWPPVFPRLESIFCDPPAFQFNSSHAIHFKITTGE